MRISPLRALAVTAGLVTLGAACGAALAFVFIIAATLRDGRVVHLRDAPALWFMATVFGGFIGAVLAPALAWVFLRRVPLGQAIAETTLGAVAAGGVAMVVAPGFALAATLLGFAAAGVRLFVVSRRAARDQRSVTVTPDAG